MNELIITASPIDITGNFEEIKTELIENLKTFEIAVTDENLAEAKKMATDLNKLAKQIDDVRKAKATEFKAPVVAFEAKVKELTTLILNGRAKIIEQTEVYENKIRELCKKLLTEELTRLYEALAVSPEYRTANIDKLAISSNLTGNMKLTKKAADAVLEMVQADKNVQDTVNSRIANLESICKRAGLEPAINPDAIMAFVREPEAIYTDKLNRMIDTEISRQKAIEARMKAEAERKEREAAEAAARALKDAEQKAENERLKAEHEANAAARKAAEELEAAKRQAEAAEKRAADAEEQRRKQAIELALAEMAKEEKAEPKEKPQQTKVFFLNAKIKLCCDINATAEDATNGLKQIMAENFGEVVDVNVIGG